MGDYPDIRGWAKAHVSQYLPDDKPIPGWIFPRWSQAHPGMQAIKTGGVKPITKGPHMTTKKIVSVKGAMIRNPAKVKKPFCPVHTTKAMIFNSIRSVWECEFSDCKIIAHPREEAEQGRVTLGKGEVTLRMVCQEGKAPSIVLISDDNIALDITNLVSVDEIVSSFQMNDVMRSANVMDNVSIPVAHGFTIKTKASISNAAYYQETLF